MYRYLLFGYDNYYPSGGMNDFIKGFNNYDEFIKDYIHDNYDNYQLVKNNEKFLQINFSIDKKTYGNINDYNSVIEKTKNKFLEWIRTELG
jgi:hypothetical protein